MMVQAAMIEHLNWHAKHQYDYSPYERDNRVARGEECIDVLQGGLPEGRTYTVIQMSELLGIREQTIANAIRKLEKLGIATRHGKNSDQSFNWRVKQNHTITKTAPPYDFGPLAAAFTGSIHRSCV